MKTILIFLALACSAFAQTFTAQVGQTVKVEVVIDRGSGTPPLTYQWYKNGALIQGVSVSSFTTKATLADAGTYRVVVGNSAGASSSPDVVLNIVASAAAPVFTLQPASKSVNVGQTVLFSSLATGTPAPTYQWYRNTVAISGAVGPNYAISSASTTDVGTYTVRASNSAGAITSVGASLSVSVPVVIPANAKIIFIVSP